jgi:hypothetical protein
MNPRVARILAGGLTATALSAAASFTVFAQTPAATSTVPSQPGQFLTALAAKLGKSPSDVLTAFKAAEHDVVNQALQSGKITADQASKLNARIDQQKGVGSGLLAEVAKEKAGVAERRLAAGVAQFLGMQPKDLAAELKQGKSLAQVAQEKGKTVDQLEAYITQRAKARLDAQVQSGKLTQDRENQALQRLNANLDKMVNRTFKPKAGG